MACPVAQVDFSLHAEEGAVPVLAVGGRDSKHLSLPHLQFVMPPGLNPVEFHGCIVECSWDKFMKVRRVA